MKKRSTDQILLAAILAVALAVALALVYLSFGGFSALLFCAVIAAAAWIVRLNVRKQKQGPYLQKELQEYTSVLVQAADEPDQPDSPDEPANAPPTQPFVSPPPNDRGDVVQTRRFWLALAPKLLLPLIALLGLLPVMFNNMRPLLQTPFNQAAFVMVIASFLAITGRTLYLALRSARELSQRWMVQVVIGAIALGAAFFMVNLNFPEVGRTVLRFLDWVWTIVRSIVSWTFSDQLHAMFMVFACCLLTSLAALYAWLTNPMVLDDENITVYVGFLTATKQVTPLDKITDITINDRGFKWWVWPWVTMVIETAGQDQANDRVDFAPRWWAEAAQKRVRL